MLEGLLIAIVDDDMSIRNATQDLLKAAGFATAVFSNSASFLDSPVRGSVTCLIADMCMPGMSGIDLHEHLAASGDGIPTIIITAHPTELTRARAREAGVTCFLTKPYAPDELLECVRKSITRQGTRRIIPKC